MARLPICRVEALAALFVALVSGAELASADDVVAARATEPHAALSAAVDLLKGCRAAYAGVRPSVPPYCYGDALITLLSQYPKALAADTTRALGALLAGGPTTTADAAARFRLLRAAGPSGESLLQRVSMMQARSSAELYAEQAAAARLNAGDTTLLDTGPVRGGPPLWVTDYVAAYNALYEALGWAQEPQVDFNVREVKRRQVPEDLAVASARYQRWQRERPTLEQLLNVLPPGTLYVDFRDYRVQTELHPAALSQLKKAFLLGSRLKGAPHYFAFAAWRQGGVVRTVGAEIGAAADIDDRVAALRHGIARREEVADVARELYRVLLAAFDAPIARATQLVIAPAGMLRLLPFEVLQRNGEYLGDRKPILYGNARDILTDELMAKWTKPAAPNAGVVVANPAYSRGEGVVAPSESECAIGRTRSIQRTYQFPPRFELLPCTAHEAEAIASQSPVPVDVITAEAATETAVRAKTRPLFLHLSTHGFVREPPELRLSSNGDPMTYGRLPNAAMETKRLVEPLAAAALAFAGANALADGKRRVQDSTDDGLLSAAEVQYLDLSGTELVVMSACETAQGVSDAEEAFYGLRLAFRTAGAATVVGSLWGVNDATTSVLMAAFYKHFFAGSSAVKAMAAARRELRDECAECAHPYFWAPFVMEGSVKSLLPRTSAGH